MKSSDLPRVRRLVLAFLLAPAFGLAPILLPAPLVATARAQTGGTDAKDTPRNGSPTTGKETGKKDARDDARRQAEPPSDQELRLKGPVAWRVYQRKGDDRADIPIELAEGVPSDRIAGVALSGPSLPLGAGTYRDGKLRNVPTGGPYQITIQVKPGEAPNGAASGRALVVGPVFVGDLWILAGQSNMEGYANLVDVTPPSDRVMVLGMSGEWGRAEEPLHWLVDSPDPVHHGNPADRAARSEAQHRNRMKGAGLGLPFAVVLSSATNVPIGLIACAHGGTSMQQWDPAKKDQGGRSLYGSMLRQVGLAGAKVRGILWYQGESDTTGPAVEKFTENFTNFITAVRSELGQPELPFYYVQIGRFVNPRDPKGWNAVQEAQRQVAEQVPSTAVVASVDLELDDPIHVGTQGLKRLGVRLARIALRENFGQVGATTPMLDRVSKRADNALVVKFKGVNRAPVPPMAGQPAALPGLPGNIRLSESSPGLSTTQALEGLRPARHIAGFSIRKDDGAEVPLIYDAAVGQSRDTVVLHLAGPIPKGASLWYGYGMDPYCNLTDALDMAVPVFGPIALDDLK